MKILMKKEYSEELDPVLYRTRKKYKNDCEIVDFKVRVKLRQNVFPKSKLNKDTEIESVKKYIESEFNDFNDFIMYNLLFYACGEFLEAEEGMPFDYILNGEMHFFDDKDINAMNYVAAASLKDDHKVMHEFLGYIIEHVRKEKRWKEELENIKQI